MGSSIRLKNHGGWQSPLLAFLLWFNQGDHDVTRRIHAPVPVLATKSWRGLPSWLLNPCPSLSFPQLFPSALLFCRWGWLSAIYAVYLDWSQVVTRRNQPPVPVLATKVQAVLPSWLLNYFGLSFFSPALSFCALVLSLISSAQNCVHDRNAVLMRESAQHKKARTRRATAPEECINQLLRCA